MMERPTAATNPRKTPMRPTPDKGSHNNADAGRRQPRARGPGKALPPLLVRAGYALGHWSRNAQRNVATTAALSIAARVCTMQPG